MNGRLQDKVAVITGSTSGIGEATPRRFAAEGARVVISGRNADRGRELAAELGGNARFRAADVRREADIAALLDFAVDEFGRPDRLFNNAGGGIGGTVDTVSEEQFDSAMHLLVGSVVFGIKHAARLMGDGGGSIINNSSIAAWRTGQGGYLYSAAKAAVSHITRLAGVELGPRRIRVNAISPGAIATPIFWGGSERAATLSDDDNAARLEKLKASLALWTPLPRSGVADDIANAVLYLASDEGSYLNCHDLVVDGGRTSAFWERPAAWAILPAQRPWPPTRAARIAWQWRAKYRVERDKRLRPYGNEQYREVKDDLAHFIGAGCPNRTDDLPLAKRAGSYRQQIPAN